MRSSFVRGSMLVFTVQFTDEGGDLINPDSATLHLSYMDEGVRVEDDIEFAETSEAWSAEWDSTAADAGRVHWSARSVNPSAAQDGDFDLKANLANPDTDGSA